MSELFPEFVLLSNPTSTYRQLSKDGFSKACSSGTIANQTGIEFRFSVLDQSTRVTPSGAESDVGKSGLQLTLEIYSDV